MKKKFKMWYCYEKSSGNYKIGYATSINGKKWQRQDKLIKFKGSKSSYDKKMMCYPSILNLKNKKIMLYNGNNYGEKGFHFAEKIN